MRKTFLKWLFVFISAAFFLVAISSFYFQTLHSKHYTEEIFRSKLEDAEHQIKLHNENVKKISELNSKVALAKAHALAEIVNLDPDIIKSQDKLEKLTEEFDVDEVHISDENGILVGANPPSYVGYDMNSAEQSREFMPAIKEPNFELVQAIRSNGANGIPFQYAGVSRIDQPGIVQIGYQPERLLEAMKVADLSNFSDTFRIGNNGFLQIALGNSYILMDHQDENATKFIPDIKPNELTLNSLFFIKMHGADYVGYAKKFSPYTLVALLPTEEMYTNRLQVLLIFTCANLLIFLLIYVLVSTLLQKLVINGIYKINRSLAKITNGDLDEKINVKNTQEFAKLSKNINSMVTSLKKAHAETKKKIEHELKVAREIQRSALPNKFPPFPDHREFQIFATMEAAKDVGGDFYDFFMIDDNHLAFLIADVSGKGIPAALFMMKTKTIINDQLMSGLEPTEAITKANNILCENNSVDIFVTVFLGIVELNTGELLCINAGHNPPLLKRGNGNYEYLKVKTSFVLGGIQDSKYTAEKFVLNPGDRLFLYTDGVTEALNSKSELFGTERLTKALNSIDPKTTTTGIPIALKRSILDFTKNAEQSDDITMLAFHFLGEEKNVYKLELPADSQRLPELLKFLEEKLHMVDKKLINKIQIAAEEIFINIAEYAYPEKTKSASPNYVFTQIEVTKSFFSIVFMDTGIPYNPLENTDPNIKQSAKERNIGGLGIFMVKKLMDSVEYHYKDGMNILLLKKKLAN